MAQKKGDPTKPKKKKEPVSKDSVLDILDIPQKKLMKQIFGKEKKPSELMTGEEIGSKLLGQENYGLLADLVLDPLNIIPLSKAKYFKNFTGLDKIPLNKLQKAGNAIWGLDKVDDAGDIYDVKGVKNVKEKSKMNYEAHIKPKLELGGKLGDPGDILGKLKATLNPKNWGVTDYTDKYKNRDEAFTAARKAGEKEFMWNNQRFHTRKDTDPIKYTGNNPNQAEHDKLLREQYPEFYKTLNKGQNVGEIMYKRLNDKELNRPFIQKKSTNSKISVGEDPNPGQFIGGLIAEAAHLKDGNLDRNILNPYAWKARFENKMLGDDKMYDTPGAMEYNTHRLYEPGIAIMAHGNLSPEDIKRIQKYLGVKQDGYFGEKTYKALQDKYKDNKYIKDRIELHGTFTGDKHENPHGMGRYPDLARSYLRELSKEVPLKSYDKFKGYGFETTPSYTDNALLSTSAENMHPLLLQEALAERGYDLPKSTKKHDPWERGNFDGILGEETKSALLDYQSKQKPLPINIFSQEQNNMKRYDLGGILNGVAPMVNIAAQAINWGTQDLNNLEYNIPQMTLDRNHYMSHGVTMPGSKSFDGATHEEGGIQVDANGIKSNNPVAEVEHDEFMHKFSFVPNKGNYIFSKKLGTADMAEAVVDKYTKMKGYKNPNKDPLMKAAMEFELKNLADLNDVRKSFEEQAAQAEQGADEGLEQGVMRLGGILKKVGLSKYSNGGKLRSYSPGGPMDPLIDDTQQSDIGLTNAYFDTTMGQPKDRILTADKLSPSLIKDPLDMPENNTYLMNSGLSGALRSAVMIGDAFQSLRKAEKESPVMADYSKVNANLDSLSADLTPAKNAAASAFNEGNQQIRDGSTSLQSYMTRRMGSSAQQAEVLSQIAAKEREMKNAIHQTKAGIGVNIAVDDVNRKYQNRVDNLMNKAAKEAFIQRMGDNMLGIAKAMDSKQIAEMTILEGNSMMKAMSDVVDFTTHEDGTTTVRYKAPKKTN